MNAFVAVVLLAVVTSSTVEESEWLWQFVDDEQADYMKLSDREIERLLGEAAGEGEGEGDGVGNEGDRNESGQAPTFCLELAKPGILFDGFFKPISDMNWYLVGNGYEETSGGAWCPHLPESCETVSKNFISPTTGFFAANSIIDLATRVQSQYLERGVGMPGAGIFCRRKQKDDMITMTYSFIIQSIRSVEELSNDYFFSTEMKKVGLKILGLPASSLKFIEVAFHPERKLFDSGRRLSGSVSVEYTAEIPKANAVDVTVASDPDALETDVLAAVKSAEDASGKSYGVTVDSASLTALTSSLGSAWTDAVADVAPAVTPAPTSETPSTAPTPEASPQPTQKFSPAPAPPQPEPTPVPEPTQAPVPESTQVPAPEPPEPHPEPEPTPVPEPTQAPFLEPTQVPAPEPTQATAPEPTQAPTASEPEPEGPVPTPTPTYLLAQVEELSSASIRNASGAWSFIALAIATAAFLADVAKP